MDEIQLIYDSLTINSLPSILVDYIKKLNWLLFPDP